MHRTDIHNAIDDERDYQDATHGTHPHTPLEWLALITEEVGEVATAINHLNWSVYPDLDQLAAARAAVLRELTHVAATAVAALEDLSEA